MYKLLLNSAAAFAFALPLAFGLADSSHAADDRTDKEIQNEIDDLKGLAHRAQSGIDLYTNSDLKEGTAEGGFYDGIDARNSLRGSEDDAVKKVHEDQQELQRRGSGN